MVQTDVPLQVARILKKLGDRMTVVRDGLMTRMATDAVGASPVDTGAYVESHSIRTHSGAGRMRMSDAPGRLPGQNPESKRSEALQMLMADIEALPKEAYKVYLTNRAPHANAVEQGGHNWNRGGYFVYTQVRAKVPIHLDAAITEAKARIP